MLCTKVMQIFGFFFFFFGVIALKKVSSPRMLSVELPEQNLSPITLLEEQG